MRDFYFDQLQRLLLPPHTRLMLYLIGQGDHFFERSDGGSGDSGGIWRTLCRDIGLTPEQEERLKAALKCVATARHPCMVGVLLPLTAWRLRMCGVCVCAWQEGARHTQACVGDEDAGERRGMGLCGVVLRGMATSPRELMTPPHAQDFVVRFRKSMFDRAAELDSQMSGMYSVLAPAQVRARHATFALLYTCPTHSSGVAGGVFAGAAIHAVGRTQQRAAANRPGLGWQRVLCPPRLRRQNSRLTPRGHGQWRYGGCWWRCECVGTHRRSEEHGSASRQRQRGVGPAAGHSAAGGCAAAEAGW